jgi:aldehyde dehydrogenase (NAD+)
MIPNIHPENYQVNLSDLQTTIPLLRNFFDNGTTLDVSFRKKTLERLQVVIEEHTKEICEAVYKDFHKPEGEMLLTEIYTVLAELKHTIAKIQKWSSTEYAMTNILLQPARSRIHKSPKGLVLIIAPWNYPFYLSMMPLISAIASGNVVVIKPASETFHTSLIIKKIIENSFDKHHVNVVLGEGKATGELLLNNFIFNHIFFTGSARVGKWIMSKAAENLTPITLELGGKSPAIIDKGYDIDRAAKKIVWGKFINSGQTCVSPDYVLIHKSQVDGFVQSAKKYIGLFFGEDIFVSETYSHMINEVRYQRVCEFLKQGKILHGGKFDDAQNCIEPTLLIPHSLDEEIMKEEIFGPILPLIIFEKMEDVLTVVRKNRYPLSLYLFTDDSEFSNFIYKNIEFGGGCENTTVYHLGNPYLPFGGIQNSGMGSYHGKFGFDTFSNLKPVLQTAKWFDIPLLYQPYTSKKLNILRHLFKL